MASRTSQPSWRFSRSVTLVPSGASAASRCAAEPRATSTAVPGAIGTDALCLESVTPAKRSAFVNAPSNGASVTASDPGTRGVAGPQSGVKMAMPFGSGASLKALRSRPWTEAAPAPGEPHLLHVEKAVERDARARAVCARRAHEDAVAHEDPARPTLLRRVEVAVDADHGRLGRDAAASSSRSRARSPSRSRAPARAGTGRRAVGPARRASPPARAA